MECVKRKEYVSEISGLINIPCWQAPKRIYTRDKGIYGTHGTLTVNFEKKCCEFGFGCMIVYVNGEPVLFLNEGDTQAITLCDIEKIEVKCFQCFKRCNSIKELDSNMKEECCEDEKEPKCPPCGNCCGKWCLDLHYKKCC